MHLFHNLKPDIRCISAIQAVQRIVVFITNPNRRGILRGYAAEPDIRVRRGGTGLTGDGHAGEAGLAAGAAGDDALEGLADDIGGGGFHGHVGLLVVLADQVALGVLHPIEGPGRGVHAIVDEGPIGRGHLLGGDAVFVAAQAHVAGLLAVGLGQGGEAQLLHHEGVGLIGAQLLHRAHGAGVQRADQGGIEGGQAPEAAAGVGGPCAVAGQVPDGIVVDGGGGGDGAIIQSRGVHGHGLGGRTRLTGRRGPVPAPVHLLGAGAAHHGHHVPGVGVHNGDGRLERLALGVGILGVVGVFKHGLGDVLDLGVLGGVDLVPAVIDLADGLFKGCADIAVGVCGVVGQAKDLHKLLGHIGDDLVGEVGVVGGADHGGLFVLPLGPHIAAQVGVAVGEYHLLGFGGVIGGLVDLFLGQHGVQHVQLAVAVLLPGPVAAQGVILGGVVGDADETRALRQGQLGYVLVEVHPGGGLHAVALVAQVDGVQVHLQNFVFGIVLFQGQSPVHLRHLALDGVLVVAGDVLDELLGDGGAALGVALGKGPEHGPDSAMPVHTVVALEALVLDGDGGLAEVLGDGIKIHPDAVFVAEQGLVHDQLLGIRILIVQLRGHLLVVLGHVHLHMPLQGRVDVGHEDPHEDGGGQHGDQEDGTKDDADGPPHTAALSGLFPCFGALLCLFRLVVFVHRQGTFLSLLLVYAPHRSRHG